MGQRDFERSDTVGGGTRVSPGDGPSSGRRGDELERPAGAPSRRSFMRLAGGIGGATAASVLLAACGGDQQSQSADEGDSAQPGSDEEVLNYLLYLEYLEEAFYERVLASGRLTGEPQSLIQQVRQDEREHVDVLQGLVQQFGIAPVPRPKPDFDAVIAGGQQRILETAATLENLGAAGYLGQVTNIVNNPLLQTVLTVHSVEGRHAAALNEVAGTGLRGGDPLTGSIPDGAFAEPMTREQVLDAAAQYVRA